jgi:hypothetical protein
MTRIEAEAEAKELNKVDPKWFCPLINAMCRKDCINFVAGYVQEIERKSKGMLHDIADDNFEVSGFVCSNAAFIGDQLPCMGGH